MKNIFKYLTIPSDKANHIAYGALVSFAASFALSPIYTLLLVFIVAVLKEVYDKMYNGNVDVLDIIATMFGGTLVCIPLYSINLT